jgi:hypothetical protein
MRRRNSISESWAARPIEMLESPAYRALSLSAHRVLSRIEVEFAHHAGWGNGKLVVTFDDFEDYGVRRHSIGRALIELQALGFIAITEHGRMARAAEYRRPNKYELLSRPKQKGIETVGRWRRFATTEEAKAILNAALKSESAKPKIRQKRKVRQGRNGTESNAETALEGQNRQCRNGTTKHDRNGTTIYISGREPDCQNNARPTPGAEPTLASDPQTVDGVRLLSEPSYLLAAQPFLLIDGVYRIAGRAERVVAHAAPSPTLPLAKPSVGPALAQAAE